MVLVYPGQAISHQSQVSSNMGGTLGALLRVIGEDIPRYAVTCSHVAAPLYSMPKKGDKIYSAGDVIGELAAWTLHGDGETYTSDAALIRLNDAAEPSDAVNGRTPITGYSKYICEGLPVSVWGQNDSSIKRGKVTRTSSELLIYKDPGSEKISVNLKNFVECISDLNVSGFGDKSDSGSAVLNSRGRIIGIFAASGKDSSASRYFCRMSSVLRDLSLLTEGLEFEVYVHNQAVTPPRSIDFSTAALQQVAVPDHTRPNLLLMSDAQAAIDVLARTLWAEARNDYRKLGAIAYEAICEVIFNRAKRLAVRRGQKFNPALIIFVCKQKWQFSCWNPETVPDLVAPDSNYNAMKKVREDNNEFIAAKSIASAFLSGETYTNHAKGVMHYYNPADVKEPQDWITTAYGGFSIGSHVFLYGVDGGDYDTRKNTSDYAGGNI